MGVSTAEETGRTAQRLSPLGVAARVVLLLVMVLAFGVAAVKGDDPWWPLAPWRMFSTSTPPSTAVVWNSIEIRVAGSEEFVPAPLTPWTVGLNRAEVEGQIPEISKDPARLGTLARSHSRLEPDEPEWIAVRLVRNESVLAGRRPTGEIRHTVVASWGAA